MAKAEKKVELLMPQYNNEQIMKYTIIILFISCCLHFNATAQNIFDLKKLILTADSIYLASHVQTDCVDTYDEKGRRIDPKKYKIAYQGKLNSDVVKKLQRLPDSERAEMIDIITQKNNDSKIETCNCFIPFHSILVFNKGKVSYMDICFGCNTYAVGIGDSRRDDIYLTAKAMTRLYDFFLKNNFPFE